MKLRLGIFVLPFLVLMQSFAWAEMLVVGVSTGYPPYYYKSNGKLTGFCVEVVNAVAKSIDLEIEYKEYPWMRLMHSAQQGEVDAIMPLFRTKEREAYLHFENLELAYETNYFFTTNDFTGSYEGRFENLLAYRIGVVVDYSYGHLFDSFEFSEKEITLNDTHLIEMFKHQRFDVGVGSRSVVLYFAEEAGVAKSIKFLAPPISNEKLYLGFARQGNNYALTEQFGEALQKYTHTTQYFQLAKKYGVTGL